MARTWLIDSRRIASKVKNATQFSPHQIKDFGAYRDCPSCHHRIDNSDVSHEWPGLPAGVKFDPSDVELLEHLARKIGHKSSTPHPFIDEFIPTLEGDEGICYTHPENLPGAKKDGNSVHFFHRTSKAYATGERKRRKIHGQSSSTGEQVRWHKTGKTKAVMENGVQKGCKKIMVLYKSSKKGSKPDKAYWVMHQYHLGTKEDEREGEFLVSKIFYQQQQKQSDKIEVIPNVEELVALVAQASPSTPKTYTPNPPRLGKRPFVDDVDDESVHDSPVQVAEYIPESPQCIPAAVDLGESNSVWLAGESHVVELPDPNATDSMLFCNEILDSYTPVDDMGLKHDNPFFLEFGCDNSDMPKGENNPACGFSDFDNLELGTPPDLADLQFGSQESFMGWLDRL